MRVLHAYKVFPPDVVGGIPEAIAHLAKGMSSRHESSVLVARNRGWGRRYDFNGIPVEGLASFGTAISSPIAPSLPFVLAKRSRSVDLAAFHHPFPLNDIGAAIGLYNRTALVVHWHCEIVGREALVRLVAPFLRRTLRRAQHIIVSHQSLISGSPFLREYRAKCTIIPYGIDVAYWTKLDADQRRRVEVLRARHPRLIVATGRLVRYKGLGVLIEALRQVDGAAIIVGEGPLRHDLLEMARHHGVSHKVILAGKLSRDDLKIHLHAAQVYALPSVTMAEAFGIAQIEAMAVGLPIVNTNLPTGVPHVARHGQEALTVPPNDADALSAAITRLLDNHELSRRLGTAGRARAMAEYTLETFVARTEDVYERAVRSLRGPSYEAMAAPEYSIA